MNPQEISEIAKDGVDVQLHTHRHRTPDDEALFQREIEDNRRRIESLTGRSPQRFCYPSGVYRQEFISWLQFARGVTELNVQRDPAQTLPRLAKLRSVGPSG